MSNLANNALDLGGDSNVSATGGVVSYQENEVGVNAFAQGTIEVGLATDTPAVNTVNGSSVDVSGNSVSALALGNQSANDLTVEAGAGYRSLSAGASGTGTLTGGDARAEASYAVLNGQTNSGPVSATVADTTAGADFNGTGGTATVNGSSLTVANNSFSATAVGNSATNRMTASARPAGNASMALTSSQVNSGPVTASANNVSVALGSGGVGTQATSSQVGGNSITASATGNSVSNSMSADGSL
ncbi:MAG: hypothetical protein U5L11_00745 [Arhodomonas sp.]|nr:hypothetical protein [Arhodomonas sp.]